MKVTEINKGISVILVQSNFKSKSELGLRKKLVMREMNNIQE